MDTSAIRQRIRILRFILSIREGITVFHIRYNPKTYFTCTRKKIIYWPVIQFCKFTYLFLLQYFSYLPQTHSWSTHNVIQNEKDCEIIFSTYLTNKYIAFKNLQDIYSKILTKVFVSGSLKNNTVQLGFI